MRIHSHLGLLVKCLVLVIVFGQAARGGVLVPDDRNDELYQLYDNSYALLIGVSEYTSGWDDLSSIPGELELVEKVLRDHGFVVEKHVNRDPRVSLDSEQLKAKFSNFINRYGYNQSNRLLFYFSGHGHTWVEGGQGYLVPSDAPVPVRGLAFPGQEFLRKALHMSQIMAWSRQMIVNHVLFLFDSCFSGTIFQKKGVLPKEVPGFVPKVSMLPVRQFITAGDADEEIPARSTFARVFVDALKLRKGDLNDDGFVTGLELAVHLRQVVPRHANQTPLYGAHPDYQWARGDFVFQLARAKQDLGLDTSNIEPRQPGVRIQESPKIKVDIYTHDVGFTADQASALRRMLESYGIAVRVQRHRDASAPDAVYVGALVTSEAARRVLSAVPYQIKYIFKPNYPVVEGGDPSGYLIGVGYMSTHYEDYRGQQSEPVRVSKEQVEALIEPGLSNTEFQLRLRTITGP